MNIFVLHSGLGGGWVALIAILCFFAGLFLGGVGASSYMKKQIENQPAISEQQIRELYRHIGKKPSEAQVARIMHNIKSKK